MRLPPRPAGLGVAARPPRGNNPICIQYKHRTSAINQSHPCCAKESSAPLWLIKSAVIYALTDCGLYSSPAHAFLLVFRFYLLTYLTYGASARKPSAPETYGGLVWNNPAGRESTRGEDSTGRDEDAKHLAWLRAVLGGGGRIDSWPVLAFGAKWIISGRQREFDADGRPTSQMHSYGTVCNLCIG